METWFLIIITISIAALLRPLLNLFLPSKNLPPGPFIFPIIGHILWLRKSFSEIEAIIRTHCRKFGPLLTFRIGSQTVIIIGDRSLAHQALIKNAAIFSNRPAAPATTKISSSNQHTISSSFYGPTWRVLRRNLTSEILHPSRVKSYSHARQWVLEILLHRLRSESKSGDPVRVLKNFQYAMFCLLVLMCFGDKLNEKQIEKIQRVERSALLNARRFAVLNFWPSLTKILLKKRWSEFFKIQKERQEVVIPLIRARKKVNDEEREKNGANEENDEYILAYVDTLLNLQLPDEKRKLTEMEIQSMCNEFLNAGTDTTSTALQWIMANLVKYPEIQEKLFMEMKGVVEEREVEVKEDDLQKMPYLKAIILEGLRRHPPGHLVVPHAVTEDVVLDKYLVPKNAEVNFMVADIGWDPNVWEDPMAFKPERFVGNDNGGEAFDITGSREIKMMPFGVGRRMCPGFGLAMLHLEYFVANLIWNFEWKAVDGDEVDLTEKQEFTIVMKNPLQAHISPRIK